MEQSNDRIEEQEIMSVHIGYKSPCNVNWNGAERKVGRGYKIIYIYIYI